MTTETRVWFREGQPERKRWGRIEFENFALSQFVSCY